MDSRQIPRGITILPLQVPLHLMPSGFQPGDIIQLSGTGFTELGVPFKIPEDQSFRIECPDLIPDGAD